MWFPNCEAGCPIHKLLWLYYAQWDTIVWCGHCSKFYLTTKFDSYSLFHASLLKRSLSCHHRPHRYIMSDVCLRKWFIAFTVMTILVSVMKFVTWEKSQQLHSEPKEWRQGPRNAVFMNDGETASSYKFKLLWWLTKHQ